MYEGDPRPEYCPSCGFSRQSLNVDDLPPAAFYHPWHIRNREALSAYVESLADEAREWLLALYVDSYCNLLSVQTIARGGIADCKVDIGAIYIRGRSLDAAGYFLVHNHPSGDPTPSRADVEVTRRLRRLSSELGMPLIDHVIVARKGVCGVAFEPI